ncbi:hypothetical protein LAWI1_G007066 [Lachnellula willkommii]|uniref:Fungal N-terminal domain-containing protein n=1 Tax=Lachnellula willkommii TaxID=215461 RepID=A0A559M5T4_9HELO|nr:hypothetical protein LAWI1_G007066 [Lachnellula willkommii]
MSFGYSVGDFMLLTQLAYRVVQNARKACGAHHDLAREIGGLHIVLGRVEVEVSKPDSILNNNEDNRRRELEKLARHCERVLNVLEQILNKYNALSDERRSVTKLWQKVKFGNGEMLDLGKIRAELATHTQALNLFLNLLSIGSQGKVEKYMDSHGEELRDIKHSLHWVTSSMQAKSHEEKSTLTTYGDDDKAIWKAFRRELIEEGFSARLLDRHKSTIKNYVMELGARGALDEPIQHPRYPNSKHATARSAKLSTEDERAGQDSLTQLEELLGPTAITSGQQMEEGESSFSSKNESDEDNDQGRFTPLKPLTNISARTAPQNKSTNPLDTNSDKDELPSVTISQYIKRYQQSPPQADQLLYEAHGEAEACIMGPPKPSTQKPRSKFRATVEDVQDEEFANSARLYKNGTSNGTETLLEEISPESLHTDRDDTDLKKDDEDESQASEYQERGDEMPAVPKTVSYLPLGKVNYIVDPEGTIYSTNLHTASIENIGRADYLFDPEPSAAATCPSVTTKSEPGSFQDEPPQPQRVSHSFSPPPVSRAAAPPDSTGYIIDNDHSIPITPLTRSNLRDHEKGFNVSRNVSRVPAPATWGSVSISSGDELRFERSRENIYPSPNNTNR